MSKKYTYEYVKNYCKSKGYELISNVYVGANEHLIITDIYGYIYKTTFSSLLIDNKPYLCGVSNPYSIENIKLWLRLNNKPFKLVDTEFIKVIKHLTFIDNEGYLYYASMNTLLNISHNLLRFDKSNPYTIQNIKLWCKLNNKPFELVSEKYDGNNKHLEWHCLKSECGEIFKISWNNILHNEGCSYCTGRQVGLSNCLATKNPELAKEWHPTKNGELTPYDITCGNSKIYIWWQCLVNPKHIWRSKVLNRTNGNGCPECKKSKGEIKIKEVFINKNFIIISQSEFYILNDLNKYNKNYCILQKTFDNLIGVGNKSLSYDFYVPIYNLLIEYQGEFHDQVILKHKNESIKLAEKRLIKQQEHDRRKKEYAKNNNIKLLEIWYYDFDNIEEILNQYLNDLKVVV